MRKYVIFNENTELIDRFVGSVGIKIRPLLDLLDSIKND